MNWIIDMSLYNKRSLYNDEESKLQENKPAGVFIDYHTADKITHFCLKDHYEYLTKEMENYKNGGWMHPEDVILNQKLIESIGFLLDNYFTGE